MIRLAALLLITAHLVLLLLLHQPSGRTAILFTFVGTPLMGLGLLVLAFAGVRARRRKPPPSG